MAWLGALFVDREQHQHIGGLPAIVGLAFHTIESDNVSYPLLLAKVES